MNPELEPDWIKIEAEYRAAQMSISGLCQRFEITREQLNTKVAQYGWTRNLVANVRAATEEVVLRRTAGPDAAGEHTDFVEKAADRTADLVMGHRKDISDLRMLAQRMLDRLTHLVAEPDAKVDEELNVHPLDVKLLGKNDGTLSGIVRLTDAFARIIGLERQAYGLDDPNAPADPDAIKRTVEEARAELLRRGTVIKRTGRGAAGLGEDGRGTGSLDGSTSIN